MSDSFAITPRNLGSVRLPGYCPRCFKRMLTVKFHAPYSHFGAAIFNDAQRCQEAIIGHYLDQNSSLPKQFAPFCDCTARVNCSKHWSKFRYTHSSGVVLYGSPDEVLERRDGTICIMDHKTSHFKEKDPFHEQYEVQVVGYGNIAEGLELGEVTLGGLLYWDAQVKEVLESPSEYFTQEKLWMPFSPKGLEIKIDYKILDPLLKELKKISNAKQLPEGRDGCDDCKKLDLLFAFEQKQKVEDRELLRRFGDISSVRNDVLHRQFMREVGHLHLLTELDQLGDGMFTSDGVVANWEFQ